MTQERIRSPFSDPRYAYLEKFLTKFGESNAFSVCVKDIETKRVCLNNTLCSDFWGLEKNAMQGMTAREILTRVPNFTNVETELETIEKREEIAIGTRQPSVFQQLFLSYQGFVQVRQSIITPLNGISNRLIATAGIALDLTKYIQPSELLDFYRYYYPKRAEAVLKCSAYFKLDRYFYQALAYEELRTLLAMVQDYRHKHIAETLGVAPKTIANYLASIRDKLKPGFEIYTVLSALRAQKEYTF